MAQINKRYYLVGYLWPNKFEHMSKLCNQNILIERSNQFITGLKELQITMDGLDWWYVLQHADKYMERKKGMTDTCG